MLPAKQKGNFLKKMEDRSCDPEAVWLCNDKKINIRFFIGVVF